MALAVNSTSCRSPPIPQPGIGGDLQLVELTAKGVAKGPGVVLTYALPDGAPTPAQIEAFITRPGEPADGERLYHKWCARCHGSGGVSSSGLPDLRASLSRLGAAFDRVALSGLPGTGMPKMELYIGPDEAELIRRYVESR